MDMGRVSHLYSSLWGLRLFFLSILSPFRRSSRTSFWASSGWRQGERGLGERPHPTRPAVTSAAGGVGASQPFAREEPAANRSLELGSHLAAAALGSPSQGGRSSQDAARTRPLCPRPAVNPLKFSSLTCAHKAPAVAGTAEDLATTRSRRTAAHSPKRPTEATVKTEDGAVSEPPRVAGPVGGGTEWGTGPRFSSSNLPELPAPRAVRAASPSGGAQGRAGVSGRPGRSTRDRWTNLIS